MESCRVNVHNKEEMNVLKIENLSFSYKNCEVLKGINYSFNKGEIYSIVGHNGAGKTTLIRLCLNLLPLQKGNIEFKDNTIISYVPDRGGLYEWLTVKQNLEINLELYKKNKQEKQEYIEYYLKKWGLTEKGNVVVRNLSMGQRQRLSIIVAGVNDPDLLFLDEPTNSIDINSQELLNQHLLELKSKGKTIIISSHDIHLIEKVSDKILILDHGKIVFQGQMNEIKDIADIYKKYAEEELC